MFKTILPILMIAIARWLWGTTGVSLAAAFSFVLFAIWAARRWLYVRVPELETAVVYRTDSETFARFLAPGHYWIMPFLERIGGSIPTAPGMVTGQCINAETTGGIPLTLEWSLSYKLNPFQITADARPKLARSLQHKAGNIARNHVNNCVRHVIGNYTIETLSQPHTIKRLEREIRQQTAARLAKLGFEVSRIMLGAIEMPAQVRAALAETYQQQIRTEREAQSLARLHQVVSQFSETDMARLMELERIYKLGENGVTMWYAPPTVPPPPPIPPQNGRRHARPSHFRTIPPDAAVAGLS